MQDSYREIFLSESQEYLNNISKRLIRLEEAPGDSESLNEIFRCLHTLKGMSATMGFDKLAQLSHQMEDLLDDLRNKRKKVTSEIIDRLFYGVDMLGQLIEDVKLNQDSTVDTSNYLKGLKNIFSGQEGSVLQTESKDIDFNGGKIEILNAAKDTAGLNIFKVKITLVEECVMKEARAFLIITNLKQMGQIIKSFPALEDLKKGQFDLSFALILATYESAEVLQEELLHTSDIDKVSVTAMDMPGRATAAAAVTPSYIKKIQSMRIPVKRLDKIMNLMEELAIAKIRLVQLAQTYKIELLQEISFLLSRLTSSLQDEIMQTRLVPIAYILDTFPRLVRDLAKNQNKEIDLEIIGSDIELDRAVLDEIGDPLVHLVRNAIDHGIESPEKRKACKKNPRGKILIKVLRQKGQISIEVADDGGGVDFQAVQRSALAKGLISEEEAPGLDERKIFDLIALPGFSTSQVITEISGRGVGLDAVKAKAAALGGRVDFETKPGLGSRFVLTLPLTLAIIKAMLVKVGEEIFAVPLMNIREAIRFKEDEIKIIQHFEVVTVRDEVIPVVRLSKELGIPDSFKSDDGKISLVIVEYGQKSIGLMVSQVIGEQDIVVKPLGALAKRTKGIAGATILGDGRVALILDIMSIR